MPRYAFKIEYDGSSYFGWQRQREGKTVQGEVEKALSKLEPNAPSIVGSGRTDTGVHALGQVAHLDAEKLWEPDRLRQALNHHLKPEPIALVDAAEVDPAFHARFDAIKRRYIFRMIARRSPLVTDRGFAWHIGHRLDVDAMREGAAHLLGKHDFTTFRSTMCQAKSPVKTLDRLDVIETRYAGHGHLYEFQIEARSFLHNQVRSFIGTLERVGAGAWDPIQVKQALEAQDRQACGPVSPPEGLYLSDIWYPHDPFAPSS